MRFIKTDDITYVSLKCQLYKLYQVAFLYPVAFSNSFKYFFFILVCWKTLQLHRVLVKVITNAL